MNKIKKAFFLFCKSVTHIKEYGIVYTYKKTKSRMRNKKREEQKGKREQNFYEKAVALSAEKPLPAGKDYSVAVHIHLFYEDLLEEFITFLQRIPCSFDLFLSCREETDLEKIRIVCQKQLLRAGKIRVEAVRNQGRDIAPFYVVFGKELEQYAFIMHAHSKKSLHFGEEQHHWRQSAMQALLPADHDVREIFGLMETEQIGLFFPDTPEELPIFAHTWLSNERLGKELLKKLDIEADREIFNYPVGSFFWAKGEAIHRLFELGLSYEDFPEESGQKDGTIAHVLERVITFVTWNAGYHLGIYDRERDVVRIDESKKLMAPYFAETREGMLERLLDYDLISFDVFHTLVNRTVYHPDDIFRLTEVEISAEGKGKREFVSLRRQAEKQAFLRLQDRCTLSAIYEELQKLAQITDEERERWKQTELETMIQYSCPREDILWVYEELKKRKKQILIITDSYLERADLERLLQKNGYKGYQELWLSNEMGGNKEDGTMWEMFLKKYKRVFSIHVGNHVCGDIQKPSALLKDTYWLMNSQELFQLSEQFASNQQNITESETELEKSLALGTFVYAEEFNSPFALRF